MRPFRIANTVEIDALAAAGGLARRCGTVLLHDQTGHSPSILLFDPRWTCRFDATGPPTWSGDVPTPQPPAHPPLRWPFLIQRHWADEGPGRGGGLAGWFGFDLGPAVWDARHPVAPPFSVPDAWLGAFDLALVFQSGRAELVARDLSPWTRRQRALRERWEEGLDLLRSAAARGAPTAGGAAAEPTMFDRAWHARAVDRIRAHLRAGDVYQINLTGFATAPTTVHPWAAFLEQARVNPVPYAAYVHTGEAVVTSHSPELLLGLRGRRCETRPIKGTVPSGAGDFASLQASEKDRAEHVMIVDLCRHDLGRVCEYGTVKTPGLMEELRLQGLVHLVSRIEGVARPGARDRVLESLFPGGSITGAPKRRAQEILRQVEASQRGPYTGSIGYLDADGSAQWNIAIRTAVWQNDSVAFGCGGGIVLDSDAAREYDEAQLKAASFFDTLRRLSNPAPLAARAGGL